MKAIGIIAKIMANIAKYAGILIVLGETIEYGKKRFEERYPVEVA